MYNILDLLALPAGLQSVSVNSTALVEALLTGVHFSAAPWDREGRSYLP